MKKYSGNGISHSTFKRMILEAKELGSSRSMKLAEKKACIQHIIICKKKGSLRDEDAEDFFMNMKKFNKNVTKLFLSIN